MTPSMTPGHMASVKFASFSVAGIESGSFAPGLTRPKSTSASARPIGGNILIKVREEKGQTTSGLFLGLEAADKASVVGEVVQVGPGRVLRDGSRAPQPCAVA